MEDLKLLYNVHDRNCDVFYFLNLYNASKLFKLVSRLPILNMEYHQILVDYLRETNMVDA